MDDAKIPASNRMNSCSSASCATVAFWNLEIGETVERAIELIGNSPIDRWERTIDTRGSTVEFLIFRDRSIPEGALTLLAFCGRVVSKRLLKNEHSYEGGGGHFRAPSNAGVQKTPTPYPGYFVSTDQPPTPQPVCIATDIRFAMADEDFPF